MRQLLVRFSFVAIACAWIAGFWRIPYQRPILLFSRSVFYEGSLNTQFEKQNRIPNPKGTRFQKPHVFSF